MDYNLLLESNCDLLSVVEDQLEKQRLLEEYVSESEMMIAIYEQQRFIVEQDTNIFMGLKYDFIEESVFDNIKSVITNIFKKIKELITKFINFIKGKKKTSNDSNISSAAENIEKIINQNDEILKETQKKIDEANENIKKHKEFIDNRKNKTENNSDTDNVKEKLDKMSNMIDNIYSERKYTILEEFDYSDFEKFKLNMVLSKESNIAAIINSIHEISNLLSSKDNLNKLENNNYGIKEIADEFNLTNLKNVTSKNLSDIKVELIPDGHEFFTSKVTFKIYTTKYYKNLKTFYNAYSKDFVEKCTNNLESFKGELSKIEDKITDCFEIIDDNLIRTYKEYKQYPKSFKSINHYLLEVSKFLNNIISKRIKILNYMQYICNIYESNLALLLEDNKNLKNINNKIESYQKNLKS